MSHSLDYFNIIRQPARNGLEVLCYLNMLEIVQSLTRQYRIHYSTGSLFDRYSLDRRDSFQKKAHKPNIHLEYSH